MPTQTLLRLDQLEFDHENYRYGILENKDQDFIYQYFVSDSAGFKKLQYKMNTYIASDMQFIVCSSSNDNRYTVLDGNTRLSTLLYMQKNRHSFVPLDFTIQCVIFDTKQDADYEITEKHTQENFTPWTLIAQARKNSHIGKQTVQNLLIIDIYNHLSQIDIDSLFFYDNIQFNIRNCMETEQGDVFTNFYIRCYTIFKELKIDINNLLNDLHKILLNQLMLQFCNHKLTQVSPDKEYRKIINKILKRLTEIEETLTSVNSHLSTYSQEKINSMINEISPSKKTAKKKDIPKENKENPVNEFQSTIFNTDSISKDSNQGEISTNDILQEDTVNTKLKHQSYKKSIKEQDFSNQINKWITKHNQYCSKNISHRILTELSEIKPEKRCFATACLVRALGDALVNEATNDKYISSYAQKKIQGKNNRNYYSMVIKEYDKLSKYSHGLLNCNVQDIYTIFNNLYECYDELVNQLNKN